MNGAANMLLQSSGAAEFAVADVALIARTVVSAIGVPGCVHGVAVVPFEEALCEIAIVVELAQKTVNDIAVQVSAKRAS